MKNVIGLRNLFFVCMIVGSATVLPSCDDNDDPVLPKVTDVNGSYKGKMFVAPFEEVNPVTDEELSGTDIAAEVKNDTVYFNDFPITGIVENIFDKDEAADIIAQIGTVTYKVGYTAALNAAQDSIYMAFDPKPLTINLPGEGEETIPVQVTISATKKGGYELSSKDLKFNLNAEKVTVGENDFPLFKPSEFAFELKK